MIIMANIPSANGITGSSCFFYLEAVDKSSKLSSTRLILYRPIHASKSLEQIFLAKNLVSREE